MVTEQHANVIKKTVFRLHTVSTNQYFHSSYKNIHIKLLDLSLHKLAPLTLCAILIRASHFVYMPILVIPSLLLIH